MRGSRDRKRCFTLTELVIVIVIIGVLAMIGLRRFGALGDPAKDAALDANLRVLGDAIERYRADHNGRTPDQDASGMSTTAGDTFVRRLTERTDVTGKLNDSGIYGPYLLKCPTNPFNNKDTVRVGPPAAGADTHGWQYDPDTSNIVGDHPTESKEAEPVEGEPEVIPVPG